MIEAWLIALTVGVLVSLRHNYLMYRSHNQLCEGVAKSVERIGKDIDQLEAAVLEVSDETVH